MPKQRGKFNRTHEHGKPKGAGKKGKGGDTSYLSEPFTRRQLRREATSLAKQTYKPVKREIKREIKASNIQQDRINDYFPQYEQALNRAAQQSAAAYEQAGQQINQASGQATAYAEQLRQRLAGEEQANAALRGASYNAGGSNLSADAQAARINAANVLSGVTAGQAANAKTYYADKAAIGRREQTEQLLREQARQRSLRQDKRDIVREASAFKTAKIGELTDRERDFMLGQQAANLDAKNSRASRRLNRQSQRETERANRASEALSAAQEARLAAEARRGGGGGSGGSGGGRGGGGSDSSRSIGPGKIRSYIAQNATPQQVAQNPKVAIQKILNRWPYLSRRYVENVVKRYGGRGGNQKKNRDLFDVF